MHFTLADLITDITQNACESGAGLVELEVAQRGGEFRFLVRDNGKGMSPDELQRAVDPFVTDGVKHPHRKVGLGLPFLIQTAEQSGGGWEIRSAKAGQCVFAIGSNGVLPGGTLASGGAGTAATAWFDTGNVDTPPAGDLPGMFRTILMFNGPADVRIRRVKQAEGGAPLEYEVRKSELAEALGGLEDTGSLVLMDKYLRSLEDE